MLKPHVVFLVVAIAAITVPLPAAALVITGNIVVAAAEGGDVTFDAGVPGIFAVSSTTGLTNGGGVDFGIVGPAGRASAAANSFGIIAGNAALEHDDSFVPGVVPRFGSRSGFVAQVRVDEVAPVEALLHFFLTPGVLQTAVDFSDPGVPFPSAQAGLRVSIQVFTGLLDPVNTPLSIDLNLVLRSDSTTVPTPTHELLSTVFAPAGLDVSGFLDPAFTCVSDASAGKTDPCAHVRYDTPALNATISLGTFMPGELFAFGYAIDTLAGEFNTSTHFGAEAVIGDPFCITTADRPPTGDCPGVLGLNEINFRAVPAAAVPQPPMVLLVAAALGAMAAVRRGRRA